MVYGSEAILPMDLDYGAPRIRAYDEQGAEASHQDTMDQLDEARDIVLLRFYFQTKMTSISNKNGRGIDQLIFIFKQK